MDNIYILMGVSVISISLFIFSLFKYFKSQKKLKKYSKIIDIEAEAISLREKANKLRSSFGTLHAKYEDLQAATKCLEDINEISEYGVYEPKYDFATSEEYKERVASVRDEQKEMIKSKEAATCNTQWTVNGSKREGKKSTDRILKLALNAYNVECDNLILKVKYSNLDAIGDRMDKLYERIEKFLEPQNAHINREFHNLKQKELHIVHEYQEKVFDEKEEQREIKERMREEQKAIKEFETAQKKAEKEESTFNLALEKARKEVEQVGAEKKDAMLAKIKDLELKLVEAQQNKERALSMAQQTRRGHVYVISNIGSFGEEIFKIGMTRRLEPLDRVKELGDASVPFKFDVHAMIFSEDAPTLEKELHKVFNLKRVNRVNNRKEFFQVSLDEVQKACSEKNVDIKFTKIAEAIEFNQTKAMANEEKNKSEEKKNFDISEINFDEDVKVA